MLVFLLVHGSMKGAGVALKMLSPDFMAKKIVLSVVAALVM
jgi:hypothetical protein